MITNTLDILDKDSFDRAIQGIEDRAKILIEVCEENNKGQFDEEIRLRHAELISTIEFIERDISRCVERCKNHCQKHYGYDITNEALEFYSSSSALKFSLILINNNSFKYYYNIFKKEAYSAKLEFSLIISEKIESEMIDYCKLSDEMKKIQVAWKRKGGSAPKRLTGILTAIRMLIQDKSVKSHSAEHLWNLFYIRHKGKKKALKVDGFNVYFSYEKQCIFQVSSTGDTKHRGRSAFNGYVAEVKKSLE